MSMKKRRVIFFGIITFLIIGIIVIILCFAKPKSNKNSVNPDSNNQTQTAENHINEENDILFLNNELLIKASNGATRDDIEHITSDFNGIIIGYIDELNQYQIQFNKEYTYEELTAIGEELSSFNEISSTEKNHVIQLELNSYYPNDSQWKNEWSDNPGGKNWGIEAIHAPEMWELMNNTTVSNVNVGVLDNQFYIDHEDLDFSGVEYNNYDDNAGKSPAHGTHVAGTIAAVSNNEKGIAGVMPNDKDNKKVNLYGVSIEGIRSEKEAAESSNLVGITVSDYEAGFVDLIALKECKVINLSYGGGYGDSGGIAAKQIEDTLQELITEGCEFLIVKSAGNERMNYNESDLFSQMNNHNVLDRIITVGASKLSNEEIYIWEGSNYGDMVDIIAPGHEIQSTTCEPTKMFWTLWLNSRYGKMTGTSMASPHVSGVAAALWSVNQSLTGPDVKQILCDTATGSYEYESYDLQSTVSIYDPDQEKTITHDINESDMYKKAYSYSYPMLNAYEAMKKVIGTRQAEDSQKIPTQTPTTVPTSAPTEHTVQSTTGIDFLIGDWSTSDGINLSFYDDYSFILEWGYFPEEEGSWYAEAISNDTFNMEMEGSSILSMMSLIYGSTMSDYHFEVLKCNNDNFYLVQVYEDYTARTSPCKLGFTREGATRYFDQQ